MENDKNRNLNAQEKAIVNDFCNKMIDCMVKVRSCKTLKEIRKASESTVEIMEKMDASDNMKILDKLFKEDE